MTEKNSTTQTSPIDELADQSLEVSPVDNSKVADVEKGATGATPAEETFDFGSAFDKTLDELGKSTEPEQPKPQQSVDPTVKILMEQLEKERQEKNELWRKNQSLSQKQGKQWPPKQRDSMDEFLDNNSEEAPPESRPMTIADYEAAEARRTAQDEIRRRDELIVSTRNQLIKTNPVLAENPFLQNHFGLGFDYTASQNPALLSNPSEAEKAYLDSYSKGTLNILRNIPKYKDILPELHKFETEVFKKGYEAGKQNKQTPTAKPKNNVLELKQHQDDAVSTFNKSPRDSANAQTLLQGRQKKSLETYTDEIAKDIEAAVIAEGGR